MMTNNKIILQPVPDPPPTILIGNQRFCVFIVQDRRELRPPDQATVMKIQGIIQGIFPHFTKDVKNYFTEAKKNNQFVSLDYQDDKILGISISTYEAPDEVVKLTAKEELFEVNYKDYCIEKINELALSIFFNQYNNVFNNQLNNHQTKNTTKHKKIRSSSVSNPGSICHNNSLLSNQQPRNNDFSCLIQQKPTENNIDQKKSFSSDDNNAS